MRLGSARTLYVCTNHAWDFGWTFYQQLAVVLARDADVVYVDAPRSVARMRPHELPLLAAPRADATATPRLRVLRSGTPVVAQRRPWQRACAEAITAAAVARWSRRAGFEPEVIWAYAPSALPIIRRFPRAKVVYWTGDHVRVPGEERLLERADAILCVAEPVWERERSAYGDKAHFVPIAVDFERYHGAAAAQGTPAVMALPRPVLGYSGFVNQRLDAELVIELADRLGDGTVALVGPVSLPADDEARLRAAGNVVFLGAQQPEDVPRAIAGFDIALIPYVDDDFTRNSNPAKFYEYLAAGKRVVATDIPTLRAFSDVASVGPAQTFVARTLGLLGDDGGDPAPRVEVARSHSFDALMERLETVLR